ncbi:MAG: chromosome segregation protein SMC [Actinobacteria bacterium]|nr:chromosome segregation protein SMC [Actinomycetota bacterium]
MFLKSLVIRGFKSFAEKTVLEFTPGVAVIVGPNGSGKSNLVDAIAWVLGEQGPKTLRGGKMEDVIFAGTPKKPSLGRAEVALTIDNSSHILPIDFAEVTISRTMFRGGESEYAINGSPCRLLDVQELLSDTGVGRELHTIVGQGQLDSILAARPEERRAYIEEAAGILKHRRRKERAVRKLERVDADVERLGDVVGELRRQIRPLEQQAELAKRAAEIETELKECRLRLWTVDFRALSSDEDVDRERWTAEEVQRLTAAVADAAAAEEGLEADVSSAAVAARDALSAEYRLAHVGEKLSGLGRLAEERRRHMEDLALRAPEGNAPSEEEIAELVQALARVQAERGAAEQDARAAETEWAEIAAAREEAARAHEEVVQLQGERAALRSAVEGATTERDRLQTQREALDVARSARATQIAEARAEVEGFDAEETEISEKLEAATAQLRSQKEEADRLLGRQRDLERALEGIRARQEALAGEVANSGDAAVNLLADDEASAGLLGRLGDLVDVESGYERAAYAALQPFAGAVIAASRSDAIDAVRRLKSFGGRAMFVFPRDVASAVPGGVRSILEVVRPRGGAADIIRALLSRVALAENLDEAAALERRHAGLTIVTPDGDRVGPDFVSGGDVAQAPVRDLAGELREAAGKMEAIERERAHAMRAATRSAEIVEELTRDVEPLEAAMNDLDARITGAAARLGDLERDEQVSAREAAVLSGRLTELEERLGHDGERLAAAEGHLARAAAEERATVDVAVLAASERRAAERALHLGGLVERERAISEQLARMRERVARIRQEREQWEASRGAREAAARRAADISRAALAAADRIGVWVEEARAARAARESESLRVGERLSQARATRREQEAALEQAREMAHASDLARAERSHRLAALVQRLREEHEMEPQAALDVVGEVSEEELEDLRKRAQTAERRLALLGRVNPIAMEQYQSLVDRHAFLTDQMNDLKKSRRDLTSVVTEVDQKIIEIFQAAYADVAREFEEIFVRLFPGGEGRLVLTEPDNLLESGVEVEARPGGKRVKRISLLSGGERALTAIALLSSIFKARPSPFYLLDEVEAALDDVNLHRFLTVVREFKEASQILVVTHQKRTMEVADALYGISMGADGVTRVICERLAGRDEMSADSL